MMVSDRLLPSREVTLHLRAWRLNVRLCAFVTITLVCLHVRVQVYVCMVSCACVRPIKIAKG